MKITAGLLSLNGLNLAIRSSTAPERRTEQLRPRPGGSAQPQRKENPSGAPHTSAQLANAAFKRSVEEASPKKRPPVTKPKVERVGGGGDWKPCETLPRRNGRETPGRAGAGNQFSAPPLLRIWRIIILLFTRRSVGSGRQKHCLPNKREGEDFILERDELLILIPQRSHF